MRGSTASRGRSGDGTIGCKEVSDLDYPCWHRSGCQAEESAEGSDLDGPCGYRRGCQAEELAEGSSQLEGPRGHRRGCRGRVGGHRCCAGSAPGASGSLGVIGRGACPGAAERRRNPGDRHPRDQRRPAGRAGPQGHGLRARCRPAAGPGGCTCATTSTAATLCTGSCEARTASRRAWAAWSCPSRTAHVAFNHLAIGDLVTVAS